MSVVAMRYSSVGYGFKLFMILLTCNQARVLRLLAAVDFVENPALDTWAANDTTCAMASGPIAAGHRFVYVSPHPNLKV
jgi:hypothetical protein